MKSSDILIAKKIKTKISKMIKVVDFRVFGSRVFETHKPDSDLDLFIEVEKLDKKIKKEIRDIIWEIGIKNNLYISPLIVSRNELENTALRSSPIILNIEESGVTI